jgi:hypothetical protein
MLPALRLPGRVLCARESLQLHKSFRGGQTRLRNWFSRIRQYQAGEDHSVSRLGHSPSTVLAAFSAVRQSRLLFETLKDYPGMSAYQIFHCLNLH